MYNQTNQSMNGTENNMTPAYQPMQPGFSYYENSSGALPFMDPATAPDISFMTVGDEDSAYALQPDPSCKSATLPHGVVNAEESRFIEVPDFDSMTKYMMSVDGLNKRKELYDFLNKLLHTGQLSEIVGFQVLNRNICGNDCILERFNYWELCRDSFIVDIAVKLKLKTRSGEQKWSGVLVCWGGFNEKFDLIPEELVESTIDDRRGFVPLDSHLIQIYRAYEVDIEAERLWEKYGLAEALKDPSKRKARKLAERMGLTVLRLPIYEHKGLSSILFFEAGTILVGADRIEKDENGNTIIIKDDHGEPICEHVSAVLDAIHSVVSTVWNAISGFVSSVLNAISSTVSNIWNGIKNTVSGILTAISDTISNIWNNIKTAVTEKITAIKDTVVNGFNAAVDFIKNLAAQAFQWGADIINSIVGGIKNCISKVADAVKGVANKIRSFLHFFSAGRRTSCGF